MQTMLKFNQETYIYFIPLPSAIISVYKLTLQNVYTVSIVLNVFNVHTNDEHVSNSLQFDASNEITNSINIFKLIFRLVYYFYA